VTPIALLDVIVPDQVAHFGPPRPFTVARNMSSLPPALTATDIASFAYPTLKDRVPVILCKVIDLLYRGRVGKSERERDDIKAAVDRMAQLRYELQTNKPMLDIEDGEEDAAVWNAALAEANDGKDGSPPRWFNTTWMLAECYAYRRLKQCLTLAGSLKGQDCFESQKRQSFEDSWPAALSLLATLDEARTESKNVKDEFNLFLKLSLWGNKADLSLSAGSTVSVGGEEDAAERISQLKAKVVVDESDQIWEKMSKKCQRLDIVMDNVGYEMISDFVFADFLISSNMAEKIIFRVKDSPW